MAPTDISQATRHHSLPIRRHAIQMMIEKNLLREDNYFIRKLSKSVKVSKGYAKQVPRLNDEQSRFELITVLNEFDITWQTFQSYFDLKRNGMTPRRQYVSGSTNF